MKEERETTARDIRAATDRPAIGLASETVIGSLGGTDSAIQASSVVTSGARPGDAENAVGSAAGRLSITVKRVAGGPVSNWLHDYLKSGDSLKVLGPSGGFLALLAPLLRR